MWRLQSFPGNVNDSDQSISDEDEEDSPWPEKFASLRGTFDHRQTTVSSAMAYESMTSIQANIDDINRIMELVLHLSMIKAKTTIRKLVHQNATDLYQWELMIESGEPGSCFTARATKRCSSGKLEHDTTGLSSEDEVEIPEFYDQTNINRQCTVEGGSISLKNDDSTCDLDQQLSNVQKRNKALFKSVIPGDTVSDPLNLFTRGKEKLIENCSQSAIYKESETVDPSIGTGTWPTYHPFNLKERNPLKAQTDKDQNSTSSDELHDESEAIDSWTKQKTSPFEDSHHDISKSKTASPVRTSMQHYNSKCSMIELLDHLQGKNNKAHSIFQNLPPMSDEDAGELMNCGSSTDNEEIAQDLRPNVVGLGKKTMADKFQEVFGSAPVRDPRPPFMSPKLSSLFSAGLFGRFQQVMKLQKEQDIEFWKKQQTEAWPKDDARSIDVKILSRSFEAKLTVCHCSLLENEESSVQNPPQLCFQKTWKIIFNSRACNDVDLEVGKLVRIHPPWKQVQVLRCGQIIILSTYFSQI